MKVLIVCGSNSDLKIAEEAEKILKDNNVECKIEVASAHREPEKVRALALNSDADVFIAIAGLSAALPGFISAYTNKPVIGVPVSVKLNGLDALLSMVQMPSGVPVAAVGIDNAKNAAYLALRILKLKGGEFRLLKKGKVKDIYDLGGGKLLFEFSNRVSAFDVPLPNEIPFKGEVLCRFSEFWFKTLNVPNHMIETIKPNKMVVKKLNLIPIECVVRGYLYGSLYERVSSGQVNLNIKTLAEKLPEPYFDPTTKFEEKDRPITKEEILSKGWLNEEEYEWIKNKTIEIYNFMAKKADEEGFILADLKLEFGRNEKGEILLADSIGPDEFRLWVKDRYKPGEVQESFDKEPVRRWLIEANYKKLLDEARKAGKPIPEPPHLPSSLIEEVSRRYITAFEKLTGEKFR
jgi:phosphoribosylaminoimidazole-succinocarboxamide synthase